MKTAEHIIETVDKLVRKYHTRDPYELCQLLGIKIHYYDLQKKLKGFFYYQSRQKNIVIDHNVNGILERILVAHELGHAVLHTKIAMMHGFQEMEVFDDRSIEENEANFFAAELLLEDEEVLERLSEHTFFETAKMIYVPAALLDYKFSLLSNFNMAHMIVRATNQRTQISLAITLFQSGSSNALTNLNVINFRLHFNHLHAVYDSAIHYKMYPKSQQPT